LLKTNSHICCALVAIVSSVITMHWPYKVGLLFSSLLAVSVGGLIYKYYERKVEPIK
jgi:hypothetical protein